MQEVCIAILLILVVGCSSLDYEDHSDQIKENKGRQPQLRLGLVDRSMYWPGAVMYYTVDASYTASENRIIRSAIHEIEKLTCVRIRKRTNEKNYVRIESTVGKGCHSKNGMLGGAQILYLEKSKCLASPLAKGIVMHELLHALGVFHTHNAHNRDQYNPDTRIGQRLKLSDGDIRQIKHMYGC